MVWLDMHVHSDIFVLIVSTLFKILLQKQTRNTILTLPEQEKVAVREHANMFLRLYSMIIYIYMYLFISSSNEPECVQGFFGFLSDFVPIHIHLE